MNIRRIKHQAKELMGLSCDNEKLHIQFQESTRDCEIGSSSSISLFGCDAGMTSFCISWDGKLMGCQMLGVFSSDALECGLKQAWDFFPYSIQIPLEESECNTCEVRDCCQSCFASRFAETGSFFSCPEYARRDADYMSQYYFSNNKGDEQ